MPRLVVPTPRTELGSTREAAPGAVAPDDYFARVAKYVPAEVLAGFLAIENVLGDDTPLWGHASCFLALWVFTPLYLNFHRRPGEPRRLHLILGSAAFLVWAYAMKAGVFVHLGWYDGRVGAAAIILFTLVSGLFAPREGDR